MRRIPFSVLAILTTIALMGSGCASQRWQIRDVEHSYKADGDEYYTRNTFLIDRKTGNTWVLSPSEDEDDAAGYDWIEMKKKPSGKVGRAR